MNENVLPTLNDTKLSIKYFSNGKKTELDKKIAYNHAAHKLTP